MEKVEIGSATLYHGDCREILPSLWPVDACITDPPYGLKVDPGLRKRTSRNKVVKDCKEFERIFGDDQPFDPVHLLGYPKVILWGGNHYCHHLPGKPHWLIWDKRDGTTPDHNADCELAWSNLPGPARMFRHLWRGMIRAGQSNMSRETLVHPTQKPVELMAWCLRQAKLTPGQTVLDPYMGSGTLGVACANHDMLYVGIEIERRHFDTACSRIEAAQAQLKLAL